MDGSVWCVRVWAWVVLPLEEALGAVGAARRADDEDSARRRRREHAAARRGPRETTQHFPFPSFGIIVTL